MAEVNLLSALPKGRRPIADHRSANPEFREIARQFGREYFDGDRTTGYGGYRYDGRWVPVASRMREEYGLRPGDRVLDVGCAKAFLLHDLAQAVPGLRVAGLDISAYALEHAMPSARPWLVRGTADALPFADGAFDVAVAINILHNLERAALMRALGELQRVARRTFIQVDSWLDDAQRENLDKWALTAKTCLAPDDWRKLFAEAGYHGDYYWTITE